MKRVLTLKQPWATLMAVGAKHNETRSWYTPYRGELYIHSSKRIDRDDAEWAEDHPMFRKALAGHELTLSCVLCRVKLIDCVPALSIVDKLSPEEEQFGWYGPNRYAWITEFIERLPEPVPVRGSLGIWFWDGLPQDLGAPKPPKPKKEKPEAAVVANLFDGGRLDA